MRQPLKLYAVIELGIGLYALLLFEPAYGLARTLFVAAARASEWTSAGLLSAKLLASVAIILLPSILIGGTSS